jgi:hypothetical protein
MAVITQYSIVCQVPGVEPYTFRAYNGVDLTQVLGITQANMPEGLYGWVQECGEAVVSVNGQTQLAYADFRPNSAKHELGKELKKYSQVQRTKLPSHDRLERLAQLPPLLMEDGPYCGLIREARDVYVDGYFYACVAMCGISFERFQRDKAAPYGATKEDKMWKVTNILAVKKALLPETFKLCNNMKDLRDKYAHGHGMNPEQDSLKSLAWMHSFIDNETSLMRDYVIVGGILTRKLQPK